MSNHMCVSFTNEYISISMSTSRFHMCVYIDIPNSSCLHPFSCILIMSSSILLHSHTTQPQNIDVVPPYPMITLKAPIYYICILT